MKIKKILFPAIAVLVSIFVSVSCGGGASSSEARPQAEAQAPRQQREQRRQDDTPPAPPTPVTTIADVQSTRSSLMGLNVPCGFGVGEGSNEREAAEEATRLAREALVQAVTVQTHRFSQTFAGNVSEDARKRWEDRVTLMTNADVSNAQIHMSASERADGGFRVHTLMILNPERYKQALENAMSGNDEFSSRSQRGNLMGFMDAMIADFNSKYKK